MKVNHNKYRLFEYDNNPSEGDRFILGDVVYKKSSNEVGVIIQCHGRDEYRTDQFGNCCESELKRARLSQIEALRPRLLLPNDFIKGHPKYS